MNKIVWMLFFGCITWGMVGCSTEKEIRTELNSGWQFRQRDSGTWLPATVPGTVHTDLLANGKIENPFYRMNEGLGVPDGVHGFGGNREKGQSTDHVHGVGYIRRCLFERGEVGKYG